MLEFLREPEPQAVIWTAVLLILVIISCYIVKRFRDQIGDDRPTASDWMANFREIHDGGDISEKEFRTIKTVLGDQVQEELKDAEDAD